MTRALPLLVAVLLSSCLTECGAVGGGAMGGGAMGGGALGGGASAAVPIPSLATLQSHYNATDVDGSNNPVDQGLLDLGAMVKTGTVTHSASGGPNNKPYWTFDQGGRFTETASTTLVTSDQYTYAWVVRGDSSFATTGNMDLASTGSTGTPGMRAVATSGSWVYRLAASASCSVGVVEPPDAWHFLVAVFDGSSDKVFVRRSLTGKPKIAGNNTGACSTQTMTERVELGGAGANEFGGDAAAFLRWSSVVDEDDIFTYLEATYGEAPDYTPNNDTPCPSSGACAIVTLGDSTTATPTDGTGPWPTVFAALSGDYTVTNIATGGDTVAEQQTVWDNREDNFASTFDAAVIMLGINDIVVPSTGATIYGELCDLANDIAEEDIDVLVMAPTPRTGNSASEQTEHDALMTLMATPCNARTTMDLGSYAEFEDPADSDDCGNATSHCYDGLHYSGGASNPGGGTATMANYVDGIIR